MFSRRFVSEYIGRVIGVSARRVTPFLNNRPGKNCLAGQPQAFILAHTSNKLSYGDILRGGIGLWASGRTRIA
jgi:hypothetical protein